jgi:hypothetical protein
MTSTLFVIIESMDSSSGGHEVRVHGCFFDKEKAMNCMETKAKECQKEYEAELEKGNDWFNVIHGETYFVFEIQEGQLIN